MGLKGVKKEKKYSYLTEEKIPLHLEWLGGTEKSLLLIDDYCIRNKIEDKLSFYKDLYSLFISKKRRTNRGQRKDREGHLIRFYVTFDYWCTEMLRDDNYHRYGLRTKLKGESLCWGRYYDLGDYTDDNCRLITQRENTEERKQIGYQRLKSQIGTKRYYNKN